MLYIRLSHIKLMFVSRNLSDAHAKILVKPMTSLVDSLASYFLPVLAKPYIISAVDNHKSMLDVLGVRDITTMILFTVTRGQIFASLQHYIQNIQPSTNGHSLSL